VLQPLGILVNVAAVSSPAVRGEKQDATVSGQRGLGIPRSLVDGLTHVDGFLPSATVFMGDVQVTASKCIESFTGSVDQYIPVCGNSTGSFVITGIQKGIYGLRLCPAPLLVIGHVNILMLIRV